jgi:signal transduction histidine kinase/ActR/RegA family two-component response regulator
VKRGNGQIVAPEVRDAERERDGQDGALPGDLAQIEAAHALSFRRYDEAPVGMVRVSSDSFIHGANGLARTLLGLSQTDLVRAPWSLLANVFADSYGVCAAHLLAAFASGEMTECELELRAKGGNEIAVRLQSLRQGGPGSDEVVAAVIDHTMLRRSERALAAEKAAVEDALSAHVRFFASLSHELRTPLVPVLTSVQEMAAAPDRSPYELETLATIRRNLQIEIRLVNDLLDLNGIAHQKVQLDLQVIDLHGALQCAVKLFESELHRRRIHLQTDFTARRHHVKADADRLQQVFWNLLKNGIKFTPEGGHIWIITRGEGGQVSVEFRDDGAGMKAESLERVFEPFVQAGPLAENKHGGLGLGLAIARSMTEAHGGTLCATSPGLGKGASFWMRLPTAAAPSTKTAPPSPAAPKSGATGSRLLLIEDHEDSAAALSRLLVRRGYFVTLARNAAAARRMWVKHEFDLVLCDLGLPDENGIDLFKELNRKRPVKGIALSGFGATADIEQCRAAGFISHMTKPVDSDELHTAIQRALHSAEKKTR